MIGAPPERLIAAQLKLVLTEVFIVCQAMRLLETPGGTHLNQGFIKDADIDRGSSLRGAACFGSNGSTDTQSQCVGSARRWRDVELQRVAACLETEAINNPQINGAVPID